MGTAAGRAAAEASLLVAHGCCASSRGCLLSRRPLTYAHTERSCPSAPPAAAWIKAQQAQGLLPCSPVTQRLLEDLSLRPNQLAKALADGLRAAGLLPH